MSKPFYFQPIFQAALFPTFLEEVLDDNVVLVSEDGPPFSAKQKVVGAH
jgi:hypothetical protein